MFENSGFNQTITAYNPDYAPGSLAHLPHTHTQ
jgi:hypothetical protein